jgi:hypothetical protein
MHSLAQRKLKKKFQRAHANYCTVETALLGSVVFMMQLLYGVQG